jgi:hypothetical protein
MLPITSPSHDSGVSITPLINGCVRQVGFSWKFSAGSKLSSIIYTVRTKLDAVYTSMIIAVDTITPPLTADLPLSHPPLRILKKNHKSLTAGPETKRVSKLRLLACVVMILSWVYQYLSHGVNHVFSIQNVQYMTSSVLNRFSIW